MITHEEARESHKRLFESYLDGDWTPFPTRSDLDTYRDYITQQEKKDKLLELYRKQSNLLWGEDFVSATPVKWEIDYLEKALEGELKCKGKTLIMQSDF